VSFENVITPRQHIVLKVGPRVCRGWSFDLGSADYACSTKGNLVMPNSDASKWRDLYEQALDESGSVARMEKVEVAFQAIEQRLKVLPRGLMDISEMKELSEARKQLTKWREPNLIQISSESSSRLSRLWRIEWTTVLSVLLCGACAAFTSVLFRTSQHRAIFPFLCLAIIVFVGSRYGATAGILGSLLAAVVFAVLLPPVGRITIQSEAERSSVVWMVLGGVSLSYLVARDPSDKGGRQRTI